MFENVAKCIHFSSVNSLTHLCHWNQHQISGEKRFHSLCLREHYCGKGYLMNAERNGLGNILTSEAACLYIYRSVNILVIYKVPIVFFNSSYCHKDEAS